ncbi:MAG: S9 family peptidase [Terracidiphilus sp.]|jgi:dipeptidyl aminopeptidase/acylaminoacyl peptidase
MRRQSILAGCLAGILSIAIPSFAQTAPANQPAPKHAFTAKDWAALRSAAAAAISPDGTILYGVNYGGEKGPTHHEWWAIAPDGTHPTKLDLQDDFTPIGFTPDAHGLYGTWKINKLTQFAVFPFKDGKAAPVPSIVVLLPRGVQSAAASPTGTRFAIVADPRPPDPLDDVRHVLEPKQASLYLVNADGTGGKWWCDSLKSISGTITNEGEGAAAWSADGESLAVLSDLPRIGHHDVSTAIDVCNTAGARHITDIPNAVAGIGWTDGGKTLAFLSSKSAVLTPEHVWTVPAAGGQAEDRTPSLDGTAMELAGDVRGHLWVVVDHGVRNEVDEFVDGALKPVYRWPAGVVESLPVTSEYAGARSLVAVNIGDPEHSRNVAISVGGELRKITHEGDALLASIDLGTVRVVHWKSKAGIALEGIATFPPGYVEGKKYPFLVLPHGGPEANDELSLDQFARGIAGLGYVVLQPEYRGSTGYGADFLAAIYQHFGDRAYEDVDSATDFAIAQGWADPNRLAIFGWSAGGFMTSWTVTQTGRYKAAIEGAGITDWGPFLWTSDIQQTDFDARWTDEDPEAFRQFSAVAFANKVTTPLLILHGEADRRVPTFQGTEFFQILAARGKTVRMVTYPGSPHFPTLWEQRLNVFEEITDWLKKYNP